MRVRIRHRWRGWNDGGQLRFETPEGPVDVYADATVLALGGASWPGLGADPAWVDRLLAAGISVSPLVAANCGFRVNWSQTFRDRYEGQPLKRIALRCGPDSVRGEALVTATGIEGGAVYALSARLREAIATDESATLLIDLRPDDESGELATQLNRPHRKQSLSSFLRKSVRLSPVAIGLLQEVVRDRGGKLGDLPAADLAHLIKAVPIRLAGTASIDRAISSAGGVAFEDLDANFMLRRLPGVFVAGEMLDWDAPTGGYLLQASFATGAAAGNGAARWLAARHRTG